MGHASFLSSTALSKTNILLIMYKQKITDSLGMAQWENMPGYCESSLKQAMYYAGLLEGSITLANKVINKLMNKHEARNEEVKLHQLCHPPPVRP